MVYGLILTNVILLVAGQILWKLGLIRIGGLNSHNWMALFTSPPILGGIILYVIATIIWFLVLSNSKLSVAYPMQSIAYVFGMLAGLFIFNESIPPLSWIGASLIVVGVALIGIRF